MRNPQQEIEHLIRQAALAVEHFDENDLEEYARNWSRTNAPQTQLTPEPPERIVTEHRPPELFGHYARPLGHNPFSPKGPSQN
jgi:hypothetical protein